LTGVVQVAKKQSMFASSDANAAKVGVVNSGKGMTSYGDRKKHKFGDNQEWDASEENDEAED
jgi:hypothetical protein